MGPPGHKTKTLILKPGHVCSPSFAVHHLIQFPGKFPDPSVLSFPERCKMEQARDRDKAAVRTG